MAGTGLEVLAVAFSLAEDIEDGPFGWDLEAAVAAGFAWRPRVEWGAAALAGGVLTDLAGAGFVALAGADRECWGAVFAVVAFLEAGAGVRGLILVGIPGENLVLSLTRR